MVRPRRATACGWPDYARSYVGHQMRRFDDDLDPSAPTIFELVPNSLAALSVVTRGLAPARRIGALTPRSALRAHGDALPRSSRALARRRSRDRPTSSCGACARSDRTSCSRRSPAWTRRRTRAGTTTRWCTTRCAIVDDAAARLRDDAERGGWWDDTHLWIVSDHGHSPVHTHEDLAAVVARDGASHGGASVVGGHRARRGRDGERERDGARVRRARASASGRGGRRSRRGTSALADALLARESVDLLLLPHGRDAMRGAERGARRGDRRAMTARAYRYDAQSGDPLGLGARRAGRRRRDVRRDARRATIRTRSCRS